MVTAVLTVPEGADPARYIPESYVGTIPPNDYCRGWNPKRFKYCRAPAGMGTSHPSEGRCKFHGGNAPLKHGMYASVKHTRLRELYEEFEHDPDLTDIESEVAMCRALFVDFVERYEEVTEALLAWHASWQLKNVVLPEERIMDFENVVNEWEIAIREGAVEPTEKQLAEIRGARQFLDVLRGRGDATGKPRKVLDIADAHRILDTTTKIVERIEKIRAENAISRQEFFRLTDAMGRIVMKYVTDRDTLRKIREGWLDIAAA